MCGICGKVNPNGISPSEISRMTSVIAHRGPDDQGLFIRLSADNLRELARFGWDCGVR